MKRLTKKIGEREVQLTIERLPLQHGIPYRQQIEATCEGHSEIHTVTHDPANFNPEDTEKHIEETVNAMAQRVAAMCDVADFLDDFHKD